MTGTGLSRESQVVLGDIAKATDDRGMLELAEVSLGELEKQDITPGEFSTEVTVLLDISLSMRDEYEDGLVEQLLRWSLVWAATVDRDKTAQVVAFGQRTHRLEAIDLANYESYFGRRRESWRTTKPWWPELERATYLGAGMQLSLEVLSEQLENPSIANLAYRPSQTPLRTAKTGFTIGLTDGQPHDGPVAEQVLRNSADAALFWSFLYASNDSRGKRYIEGLDNLRGRRIDNSNAAFFPNMRSITPEVFFSRITKDYGPWTRHVTNPANGMLITA